MEVEEVEVETVKGLFFPRPGPFDYEERRSTPPPPSSFAKRRGRPQIPIPTDTANLSYSERRKLYMRKYLRDLNEKKRQAKL